MAYSPNYDSTGISYYTHPSFTFKDGTRSSVKLAYRLHGSLTSHKKALIPTCFGGLINTTNTFTTLPSSTTTSFSEPGALASYLVIVVATLGNGESSSPSTSPSFPPSLSYHDCINAQYALLRQHLSIDHLDAVIGFSMGGQQAYHWACLYPDYVSNIIAICSSAKTSAHNYAFLEGPKAALTNSVDYEDGRYGEKRVRPTRGLKAFGRAYAPWLTSGGWFRRRGWEELGFKGVEEWMRARGERHYEFWDPADVLAMAGMWQRGDVGSTRADGDTRRALEGIEARVLLMPCRTDQYFAAEDAEEEVQLLRNGQLRVIESVWGHLAGSGTSDEDTRWMNERIREFLES